LERSRQRARIAGRRVAGVVCQECGSGLSLRWATKGPPSRDVVLVRPLSPGFGLIPAACQPSGRAARGRRPVGRDRLARVLCGRGGQGNG
jgi:hypothetical protein